MATVPSPPPRSRFVSAIGWLIAAAILATAFGTSLNFRWLDVREGAKSGPYAGDFPHEYAGGWIVRHGESARLYDAHYFYEVQHDPAVVGFRWKSDAWLLPLYPPFYYLWCVPLSLLDYRSAAHVMTALTVAALIASVALVAGTETRARGALGFWVAASLFYPPILESLVGGQKGTIMLLIFASTYRLLARQQLFLAGAVFALAGWKPQLMLVLLLVMALSREWRFFAGLAAMGAVLGVQTLIVGWQPLLDWIGAMLHPWPHTEMVPRSHNWLGFARLLIGEYSGPAVLALWLALLAGTGTVLWRVIGGRLAYTSRAFRFQFAAIALATPLVSPHLYTYDLSILLLPLLVCALALPEVIAATVRRLWLVALGLVFIAGGASPKIAAIVPIQLSSLAVFGLLLVVMRYVVAERTYPAGATAQA